MLLGERSREPDAVTYYLIPICSNLVITASSPLSMELLLVQYLDTVTTKVEG